MVPGFDRWRVHGHPERGAELVPGVLARFNLSACANDVAWLVKNHHYEMSWNLQPGVALSPRQERFTRLPLFPLLQRVCTADQAGRVALE